MTASSETLLPTILWAQRKNIVYVTVEISEPEAPIISLSEEVLSVKAKSSMSGANYEVDIKFYEPIKKEDSKYHISDRNIQFILKKQNEGPYWPRLLNDKSKKHYIKTDFTRWVDEDEEDEKTAPPQDFDFSNMDFSQFAQQAGVGDEADSDDEEVPFVPDSVSTHLGELDNKSGNVTINYPIKVCITIPTFEIEGNSEESQEFKGNSIALKDDEYLVIQDPQTQELTIEKIGAVFNVKNKGRAMSISPTS
ncbi:HSP20-like chaperone [Rozella allomycis CSF55]|uniref:HSP20-like chaperone n=1 Tax=Rozella allomycis (strain CSF55) TaxID=988480 RepID=A0A075AW22_ROZAC|nr:HSP20-like chaperone domain-containing protein [Rozella allomycis CSF55]RKP19648.1 HSP20-like chaperone [Rozella allomycis CSF55]|eukprot:EPZ32907.1 HSP20-like chaperone domain-containing protein [Rozella allomycis CSF55]